MTLTMYDSVTISEIPADPEAVAGYVSGSFTNYDALVAAFPKAFHLSIATFDGAIARCLDVEPGDAVNGQAPAWFRIAVTHLSGEKPVLYTSASNVQPLIDVMAGAGIARSEYFVWSAHYTNVPHICAPSGCGYPQADATQYTDTALGRNLDASLVSDPFFGSKPKPKPKPDPYDRFQTGPFDSPWGKLDERAVVKDYDRLRQHGVLNRQKLKPVRAQLRFLADRVWTVAHNPLVHGKPTWDQFYRGWRFQQLANRANGQRINL